MNDAVSDFTILMRKLNQRIRETNPHSLDGRELTLDLLENYDYSPEHAAKWCRRLLETGKYRDDALRLAISAINNREQDRKPKLLLSELARSFSQNDVADHAETIYRGAIRLYPEDIRFRTQLASHLLKNNQRRDAINCLEEAVRTDLADNAAAHMLSVLYMSDHEIEKTIELLRPIYDRAEADIQIVHMLAKAFIEHGNPELASDMLQEIFDRGVENSWTYEYMGEAFIKMDKPAIAIRIMADAAQSPDAMESLRYMLARAYIDNKQPMSAIEILSELASTQSKAAFNKSVIGLLGRAFNDAGSPRKTIEKILPYYQANDANSYMMRSLGQACMLTGNRTLFEIIKHAIKPDESRDLLDARMHFNAGASDKAAEIIEPYAFDDESLIDSKALYTACFDMDTTEVRTIQNNVDAQDFKSIILRRETLIRLAQKAKATASPSSP
ncbi:MAG: hypothetical protein DI551_09575 [Micavibrio aeruginosavorus]|uniref:Uncharacterized protein n=1 Tax=Micavibrio aeruginosavorus TaxID=349221 RepID=A0A2W5MWY1_9BACT|nr:MAG: hypothetical protein DI551_09575 [Micavibrio aeruginosavorus]